MDVGMDCKIRIKVKCILIENIMCIYIGMFTQVLAYINNICNICNI